MTNISCKAIILLFFIIGLFSSCDKKLEILNANCNNENLDQFDGNLVQMINPETKQPYKDTIINKVATKYDVFAPCRTYEYQAIMKDSMGSMISDRKIWMKALGERWKADMHKQSTVMIQYEVDPEDKVAYASTDINTGMENYWTEFQYTGIIENEEQVWMHPFRENQYEMTEVAPFPMMKYPIRKGRSWTKSLSIQNGWGDWQHTGGNSQYEVMDTSQVSIPSIGSLNVWDVKATAKFPFGESSLDYQFHETYGFVTMRYKSYQKHSLDISLINIYNN